MNMLGGATNAVLFLATVVLSILNFVSLKKESPFRPTALWLQVLPLPLTIGMYWIVFNRAPVSPLYVYLLAGGLLLGLLMGALTKVYRKGPVLFLRRSKLYLFLWLLTVILTQGSVKAVGTAAAGAGTALMFLSLGMVLSQTLVTAAKAGGANRRAVAAAGSLLLLLTLLSPLITHAAPDPFVVSRDGAHAYYVLAKDAFAKKDKAAAMHYAQLVVQSTTSPGTKAKGYTVMWLVTGNSSYQGLAHTNILNSGQMKDIGGNREGVALLIGLGIIEDIEGWKYGGYGVPPDTNVITIDGVYAVANSQLPGLWKELKAKLGVAGIPALAGVIRVLDDLVAELADSRPVSSTAAAAAGAAASGILLVSSLLNLFATAATKASVPETVAAVGGSVAVAPSAGSGVNSTPTGPADGEVRVLKGSADGREYEVRYDAAQGQWINTERGTIVDLDRFEKWQQDIKQDREFTGEQMARLERREGGFDRSMDQFVADQKAQTDLFNQLKTASRIAIQHGMYRGGEPGDVTVKLRELMDQMREGKSPDPGEVERTLRVVRSRVSGQSADEASLSEVERQTSVLSSAIQAGAETYREVFTGRKADGSTSYKAMGVQVLTMALTGGLGEAMFHVGGSLYAVHDAVQDDSSVAWAVAGAMGQVLISKGISAGIGRLGGKSASAGSQKIVTADMSARAAHIKRTMAMADPAKRSEAILNTYRNGGMQRLGALEQAGLLSRAEVQELNRVVTRQVGEAVDQGIGRSVDQVQQRTGVKIKEVLVGDSGSSARGAVRSVITDADRTVVAVFDDASLQAYAKARGVSTDQAYRELTRELAEAQTRNVDQALRNVGLTADDVGYATYGGMGKGAGPADSYPAGFTRARQSVQGQTTVYRPDAGGAYKGIKTSGQTLVDQEVMNLTRYQGGQVADAAVYTAIPTSELQSIVGKQVEAAGKAASPKDAAKAMMRTQYAASRMGETLDPALVEVAQQLSRDPQSTSAVLSNAGMSGQEFVSRTTQSIKGYAETRI